jgi:hypothetical protein
MAKTRSKEDGDIDNALAELYGRAKQEKTACKCPECGKAIKVDAGGDFSEMAKAMELRISYEKVKKSGNGGPARPNFFDDEEEKDESAGA